MIAGLVRGAAIAVIVGQCGSAFAQTITPDAGAYLAARAAGKTADFSFGAAYYAEALRADPQNTVILENALTAEGPRVCAS